MNERAFVSHVVGRAVLHEAAGLLGKEGIPLLPLKGIWLQMLAYDDPAERAITDVDVLVPEPEYERALSILRGSGWRTVGSNVSESSWCSPGWRLPLDLHRRLFSRGAFSLPTHELFERGRRDSSLYGVEVVLPDPLDVFAHLVGHFVKSRGGPDSGPVPSRDFGLLASRFQLQPSRVADHLVRAGLARAARYVVPLVAAEPTRFFEGVLAALPKDPVGALCAGSMLGLRRRVDLQSPLAVLPGFVLETSLPRALRTLALRAWDRRLDRAADGGGT